VRVKGKLIDHYSKKSKHSNYQVLPESLKKILAPKDIQTKTRYEKERLKYIVGEVNFKNKTVLDIGGNTGYFSFELLEAGAQNVNCYEGNKEHAEFVGLAAETLDLQAKIQVTNAYFTFDGSFDDRYDIILLFNVLHHVGDDYGDKNLTSHQARQTIVKQLNSLSNHTDTLIFQMGFNWQGDVARGIFENGTKQEMIEFVKHSVRDHWDIVAIGIAEKVDDKIVYHELNEQNIERDDSLGEFLNRPIFILRAKNHV
jgi:2-polyprenyl-3-methyl-5-hydroxy-6-metoxy-1,4-benzoquinol methylase